MSQNRYSAPFSDKKFGIVKGQFSTIQKNHETKFKFGLEEQSDIEGTDVKESNLILEMLQKT